MALPCQSPEYLSAEDGDCLVLEYLRAGGDHLGEMLMQLPQITLGLHRFGLSQVPRHNEGQSASEQPDGLVGRLSLLRGPASVQ